MLKKDKLITKIEESFLKNDKIKRNDTLIIGLSGGEDSMCLFDIFYKLMDTYEYNMVAIHVHHGIRGEDADRDLAFVKKYCQDFRIKLIEAKVDAISFSKNHDMTLEEAARKLRYKEYDKAWKEASVVNKKGDAYVLTAHHMKDQAETIIHNMIRGTGISGIAGMKVENGYIVRPFLDITKAEIKDYVKKYDIPYVTDSTNDDTAYTRNFIRKKILAPMEELNDRVYEHISDVGKTALEISEYVSMLSKYLLKKMTKEKDAKHIIIDLPLFRNTSHIIKVYIVREILGNLVSTLKDFTRKHIEDVITLSMKEKGGHIDLPYNITVDKKQKDIIFSHNNDNISMKRKGKK